MQTITQRVLSDTVYSKGTALLNYTIRYPYFTTTCSEAAALSINVLFHRRPKDGGGVLPARSWLPRPPFRQNTQRKTTIRFSDTSS